ncbi:response regulator [Haliangium sp.]|uniref:response regulator n=1 Tax=Haliangium sp. TaxID=2663208 RepID=UPI003D0BA4F4
MNAARWYRNLRIGHKLGLGMGVIGCLVVFVVLHYSRTTSRTNVQFIDVVEIYTDQLGHISQVLAVVYECRQAEKNFLLERDVGYRERVLRCVDRIKAEARSMYRFDSAGTIVGSDDGAAIIAAVEEYAENFKSMVDTEVVIGLTHNDGLQGSFRATAHRLEATLAATDVEPLLAKFLVMRTLEAESEDEHEGVALAFAAAAEAFRGHLDDSSLSGDVTALLRSELERYRVAFDRFVAAKRTGVGIRERYSEIQGAAAVLGKTLIEHYLPGLRADLLLARRYEKDYMARLDKRYVEQLDAVVSRMIRTVEGSVLRDRNKSDIVTELKSYAATFHELVSHRDRTRDRLRAMDQAMDRVEPLVRELLVAAESEEDVAVVAAGAQREASISFAFQVMAVIALVAVLFGITLVRSITRPVQELIAGINAYETGDVTTTISIDTEDEIGELAIAFSDMIAAVHRQTQENEQQRWLKSEVARISGLSQGVESISALAKMVVSELARLVDAGHGVFYVTGEVLDRSEQNLLVLLGSYAHRERKSVGNMVRSGEGLIGQCALEQEPILLTQVPGDYIQISSGLGEQVPLNITVAPVLFEGVTVGVIELASFERFTTVQRELVEQVADNLGVVIRNLEGRVRTEALLAESQTLAEEMQAQAEELEESNQALEEKSRALEHQTLELQASNEELEERTEALQKTKREVERRNHEIAKASGELERKAKELEQASRYKSEFLANMSHELRTPLNSLLILSRALSDNKAGNLTSDQVRAAEVIHSGGVDLLNLINDILDLSKVEAGKLELQPEQVAVADLCRPLLEQFEPIAEDKGLGFRIEVEDAAGGIETDVQRSRQILKNLLSNAFKFTSEGSVTLRVYQPSEDEWSGSGDAEEMVAFAVTDTGIGIPEDKQAIIFEAFHQADGAVNRQFGGTGLGLSISRELSRLLGGGLRLSSRVGEGSTFTLYLPRATAVGAGGWRGGEVGEEPRARQGHWQPSAVPLLGAEGTPLAASLPARERAPAASKAVSRGGRDSNLILIVEDDPNFAEVLADLARQRGYETLITLEGGGAAALAAEHEPRGILLDIGLPDLSGLAVLDQLQGDPRTRHIPVHVISARDASTESLSKGALGYLSKPASATMLEGAFARIEEVLGAPIKHVLMIEDDPDTAEAIRQLLADQDVSLSNATSGEEAQRALREHRFDCIILDYTLNDMSGLELLRRLEEDGSLDLPPVIVYTGRELDRDEHRTLMAYSESIVIKGAASPERLLDEVALFVHSVEHASSHRHAAKVPMVHDDASLLQGKKILLVDDDLRNTFALSGALREYGLEIVIADHGKLALARLDEDPTFDLVLMDIMMPVMDGYECIRQIREQPRFADLPIIAVTAKAMPEDRSKCLAAGANDYLTKPVSADRVLAMIRIWLFDSPAYRNARPLDA